jgi:hypothetical protein
VDNPNILAVYPWLFGAVCSEGDCPPVPCVDSPIGILPGEMDSEESAFTFCGYEAYLDTELTVLNLAAVA